MGETSDSEQRLNQLQLDLVSLLVNVSELDLMLIFGEL